MNPGEHFDAIKINNLINKLTWRKNKQDKKHGSNSVEIGFGKPYDAKAALRREM